MPHGTVLGPLPFLIYINDIVDNITSSLRPFADDCLLYRRNDTENDTINLQRDLDNIIKWSDWWQMSFNPTKCSVLRVTRKRNPLQHQYTMMDVALAEVEHHPYSAVELSDDLTWVTHIAKITGKANRSLNFMSRNLYDCLQKLKKKTAYESFVRPNLEYASSVWDLHLKKEILSSRSRIQQGKECCKHAG